MKKLKLFIPGSSPVPATGMKRKSSAALAAPASSAAEETDVESPLARKRVKNEAKPESGNSLLRKAPVAIKNESAGGFGTYALPPGRSSTKGSATTASKALDLGDEQGSSGEFRMEDFVDFGEDPADEGPWEV